MPTEQEGSRPQPPPNRMIKEGFWRPSKPLTEEQIDAKMKKFVGAGLFYFGLSIAISASWAAWDQILILSLRWLAVNSIWFLFFSFLAGALFRPAKKTLTPLQPSVRPFNERMPPPNRRPPPQNEDHKKSQ